MTIPGERHEDIGKGQEDDWQPAGLCNWIHILLTPDNRCGMAEANKKQTGKRIIYGIMP
jgi:hypothetical protein